MTRIREYIAAVVTVIVAVFIVLCLAVIATAAEPCFGTVCRSTCRVYVELENGKKAWGTGVVVRSDLVVTNHHVVKGRREKGNQVIEIVFPDAAREHSTVIKEDTVWDLAAIRLNKLSRVPLRITKTIPKCGERLHTGGYGGDANRWRNFSGELLGYSWPKNELRAGWIRIGGNARFGDSGGPVVNDAGELVGILWGTHEVFPESTAVATSVLSEFVEGVE